MQITDKTVNIRVKRVYEAASQQDGKRILVDRLWPRGITREKAKIDQWLKDIAPSTELRQWYAHTPEKWAQFKQQYFAQLDNKAELIEEIINQAQKGPIALLFGAKEQQLNNAYALKTYIELVLRQANNNGVSVLTTDLKKTPCNRPTTSALKTLLK